MKRTLVVLSVVLALSACNKKDDNCIDPNTFENRCVEQQLSQNNNDIGIGGTGTYSNPYPQTYNHYSSEDHTTIIERRVEVQKPKSSILPPLIGGAIGGWLGSKLGSKREAPSVTIVQPAPIPPIPPVGPSVRRIPIVPDIRPTAKPSMPVYSPPRPTYTPPRPSVSVPSRIPSVPSRR